MHIPVSESLFSDAQTLMPGGVSSPVRAFRAVGGTPRFIARAQGAYLEDVDGHRYLDYVMSFGPHVLGHGHPDVVRAITSQVQRGTSFGAPSPLEIELARAIRTRVPSMQRLRFVNSGTEATMSALRAARAFTGRDLIVKFDGHYHGHADGLLAKAGSGVATLGLPDSPGVPAATAAHTLVLPFNDPQAVEDAFHQHPDSIAAIIVEPVAGNMGLVLPDDGYLDALRALTEKHGTLLIFDEVMTGFRVAPGGAQERYGITPDLTTLGKVIGGGLPVGAYGGREDVMALVAPSGPVYQAGTLSGNPLAMAAGLAVLRHLREADFQPRIEKTTGLVVRAIERAAASEGVAVQTAQAGSMFGFFLTDAPVTDWASAQHADRNAFKVLHSALLERGVYLPPSPFEACFMSSAHGSDEVVRTEEAFQYAFGRVAALNRAASA